MCELTLGKVESREKPYRLGLKSIDTKMCKCLPTGSSISPQPIVSVQSNLDCWIKYPHQVGSSLIDARGLLLNVVMLRLPCLLALSGRGCSDDISKLGRF